MASKKQNQKPKLLIAILDRGWVFIGRAFFPEEMDFLRLEGALCIRYWGTTKGIGQLALEGPQSGTKLDAAGIVTVPMSSVVALIDATESVWPNL